MKSTIWSRAEFIQHQLSQSSQLKQKKKQAKRKQVVEQKIDPPERRSKAPPSNQASTATDSNKENKCPDPVLRHAKERKRTIFENLSVVEETKEQLKKQPEVSRPQRQRRSSTETTKGKPKKQTEFSKNPRKRRHSDRLENSETDRAQVPPRRSSRRPISSSRMNNPGEVCTKQKHSKKKISNNIHPASRERVSTPLTEVAEKLWPVLPKPIHRKIHISSSPGMMKVFHFEVLEIVEPDASWGLPPRKTIYGGSQQFDSQR